MTTDVAVVMDEPNALAAWAQGAREVHQLAEHVAQSALVPQAYRGKPIDVLACWLTGQEVGIPPMAALRSIDVIKGTPSLRAHAMRGLVQSRGHDIEIVESDDLHCVMRGRRKGSDLWQTVTWDVERARRLKLTDRDQWKEQPRTMLIARATGEICRLVAADVLYAVPYASEELSDGPLKATAQVANSRPQPATIAEIVTPAEPEPVPPASPAQTRNLYRLLRATGREDKPEALRYLTLLLGREITSTKELTEEEATHAIDDLKQQEESWPTSQPPNPTPPAPTTNPKTPAEPTSTSPTPADDETPSLLDDGEDWPDVAKVGGAG